MAGKITPETLSNAILLYQSQNITIAALARQFGVSKVSLRTSFIRSGITIKSISDLAAERVNDNEIVSLYRFGYTPGGIANKIGGIGAGVVINTLKRCGITIRSKEEQQEFSSKIRKAITNNQFNEVMKLNMDGMLLKDACRVMSISYHSVLSECIRTKTKYRTEAEILDSRINESECISLFNQGKGVSFLAKKYGTCTGSVKRILGKHGLTIRNRSEQQYARMANTPIEEIRRLTKKANDSIRGKKYDFERLCRMAKKAKRIISKYEIAIAGFLTNSGIKFSQQVPIGPYNCDFTVGTVAVEIWGGHWHWHGSHLTRCEERFRYLSDSGMRIIVLCVNNRFPINRDVADYLISAINIASSDPSFIRKYWMIWGAGNKTAIRSLDTDHFTIEPPFTYSRDVTTGRYISVPR